MALKNRNNNIKTPQLSVGEMGKLQKIFSEKDWPITEAFDDKVFDNFCKLLASLTEEQRNLVFSLTRDFLWIRDTQYIQRFSESFERYITTYDFSRGKNIYICPLLPEGDFGKPKSSITLLYFIKSRISALQKKYEDFNITYADSPERVCFELVKKNYTLCLVDDFIGTGNTARLAMEYFVKNGITLEMTSFVSIVGMRFGIESLQRDGYSVFPLILCSKGITDTDDSSSKRIIMNSIEEKMRVDKDFRFGYGASEALVKMMRTPNNTFPIYWMKKNNQFAPFPR